MSEAMSADVIDFYTRQKIPGVQPQSLEEQANAILAGALSGVFPDFSSAAAYHAPEKDPA